MVRVPSTIEQVISAHELQGRKPPQPAAPLSTKPAEDEFFVNINGRLEDIRKIVLDLLVARLPEIQRIVDLHEDAIPAHRWDQDWTELVAMILRNVAQLSKIPEGRYLELARKPASDTNQRNLISMQRQIKSLLGVDVFAGFDPRTQTAVSGFTKGSVAKIKSIESMFFGDIEELVLRGFRTGTRHEEIGKQISERFEVSQKRGRLIARDQVGTLNANLARQRQTRLGVPGYIWRTSEDERVRKSHIPLNGKPFLWSKPPIVDGKPAHPGEPINCRCFADPDVRGLLE